MMEVLCADRIDREGGQDLAEYSLILAFIAAFCLLAATALGIAVAGGFGSILPAF